MLLRRTGILLAGVVLLVALGLAVVTHPVLAQNPENQACLACHSQPGMQTTLPSGETLYLTVDPNVYNSSIHGQRGQACMDCHPDVDPAAHPKGAAAWADLGVSTRRDLAIKLYRDA